MNAILEVEHDKGGMLAVPTAECFMIREFKVLIDRSPRELACQELAYVYHMADSSSPYSTFGSTENREEAIIAQVMPKGWKPDTAVWNAKDRYEELKKGPMEKLLDASILALYKIKNFIDRLDFEQLNDDNTPVMGVKELKDVMIVLRDIGKTAQGLQDLREQVEQEKSVSSRTKGQIEVDSVFHD